NYDMETLHRINQIAHGTRPQINSEPWGAGLVILVGNHVTISVSATIDFEMWRAIRPIDTLLDSAGLATLEMIVTWGAPNDMMTPDYNPAGAGVTVEDAHLFVSSVEAVGVPAGTNFMANKEYMIRSQVTATSNRHQIQLPVGNLYRWLILKTHSNGKPICTILPFGLTNQNTITLQAGTEVFKYRIAGTLGYDNRSDYELEVPELMSVAAVPGTPIDHRLTAYPLEGYYVLEFVKDGRLTECLDTSKLSSLELILDVVLVGTTRDFVDIYPCELIRPAVQAAVA
ncbi:hypothetical protein MUP46_04700, partial [Patescibacteria group bacterium]|nr:hypothetical protein [Patescibacteria group bacterium]